MYVCMCIYIIHIYICRITRSIMKLKLGKNEINALPE